MEKKLLVCITPQSNSKRLVDKAREMATSIHGELHVLHVEKGQFLFASPDSTSLLQHLFDYGTELGGVVHALCGENVVDTIVTFVRKEKITNVLLGQPPDHAVIKSMDVYSKLMTVMPYLDITVLSREATGNEVN